MALLLRALRVFTLNVQFTEFDFQAFQSLLRQCPLLSAQMSVIKKFSSMRLSQSYRKSVQMSNIKDMDFLEGAEEVGNLNSPVDGKRRRPVTFALFRHIKY